MSQDLLRSVAAVLASGGGYGVRERAVLEWLATRWGLARDDVERCLSAAARGEGANLPADTPAARREWLRALAVAVAADGVVSAEEWTMLRAVADRLQVPIQEAVGFLETRLKTAGAQDRTALRTAMEATRVSPAAAGQEGIPVPVLERTALRTAVEATRISPSRPGPSVCDQEEAATGREASSDWDVGDVLLDLYEVREVLGQGGVGKVYRVWHREWDLDLAVKSPRAEFVRSEGVREHLVREAEIWMALPLHPHVVACHYVRMLGGMPRIFAEFVDGGSLAQAIQLRSLCAGGADAARARILDVAIQFAWGLGYAHEQGLVHGDVKPANVLLTRAGQAKVTDFGLARAAGSPGGGFLTPAYCSPEQAEGRSLTAQTDVWSWATSLLEVFCGDVRWPRGEQADEALQRYRDQGADDPRIPAMPPAVADLLERCLRKDPGARPAGMAEVARELVGIYAQVAGGPYGRREPKAALQLADGLNNRAVSLLGLGRVDEARGLLRQALAADPHHIHATYHDGLLRWREGRLCDDALVRLMHEVQTSQTGTWEDEFLLARIHLERGDGEAAEAALAEVERLAAADPIARDSLRRARESGGGSAARRLEGHPGGVAAAALARGGELAVTGGVDQVLRVWDLATGTCLQVLEGHENGVCGVAVTPDGSRAVSGGLDGTLRVWDLVAARCLLVLREPGAAIRSVALSPDGRLALSGGANGMLAAWDLATGNCVRRWRAADSTLMSLALTRDGRRVLAGCASGAAQVWEVDTGRAVHAFERHAQAVTSVAWTPDGDLALTAAERSVRVWDVAGGHCLRVLEGHGDQLFAVALSADGRRAVSGGRGRRVRLWDVPSGRCLRTLTGHAGVIAALALAPDARAALSGGADGSVRFWPLPARTPAAPTRMVRPQASEEIARRRARFAQELARAGASLDRGEVGAAAALLAAARAVPGFERAPEALQLTARAGRSTVRGPFRGAWAVASLEGHGEAVFDAALTPDGRRLASAGGDGTVRLWDLEEGRCLRVLQGHRSAVQGVALSADGRWAVSRGFQSGARIWDLQSGRCVRKLGGYRSLDALAVTPDGRLIGSCFGSSLRVWSLASGRCVRDCKPREAPLRAMALTADGRGAVTGMGKNLLLWDLANGRCVRPLFGHAKTILAAALTIDGGRAAAAGEDGTVRVWDTRAGRLLLTLEGHEGPVPGVAITPDGRIGLSGGVDQTLRLWDLLDGKCLRTLEGHTAGVHAVALTPDGRRAVSAAIDRTLRVWTIDWEPVPHEPADWDEAARPWLATFLASRHEGRGKPAWSDAEFLGLLDDLGWSGFGWLRAEGVKTKLEAMAREEGTLPQG